jgi:hypothetical protein
MGIFFTFKREKSQSKKNEALRPRYQKHDK